MFFPTSFLGKGKGVREGKWSLCPWDLGQHRHPPRAGRWEGPG